MSANSSTPSPISGSRSDEGDAETDLAINDLTVDLDLGFDGAEDLLRAWRRGLRPDPKLTVSEWADAHRWLSSRASAEPGRYRTARTPYLRAIMDALSPSHPAQRVSFMKAAQVGATEAGKTGSALSSTTRRGRCWRCCRRSRWRSARRAAGSIP